MRASRLALSALAGLSLALPALANSLPWAQRPHTGELLYKLKESVGRSHPVFSHFGLPPHDPRALLQLIRPAVTGPKLEELRQEMLRSAAFKFVEYNTIEDEDDEAPSELDSDLQWHHVNIGTLEAWRTTKGEGSVTVAVCDSGAQPDHEDLAANLLPAWNLVENNSNPTPTTSHGTFVAGIIAASLNELGGVGVAPQVKLLPIRISNAKGGTTMKLITDCIRLAADRGARVINVSFTGVESRVVEEAGQYAAQRGALLVYAAGNQGKLRSLSTYPDYPHVLAVGATTKDDRRWTYRKNIFSSGGSNYGAFIDLVAPGHNIYSTTIYRGSQARYRSGSGTSYAAPVVSGVAALVFAVNPLLAPKQVEQILLESADPIGSENVFGAGRVNAHEAVRLALKSLGQ